MGAVITIAHNVHVDFPALADLVAYLNAKDSSQKKIDALAAEVRDLTAKLFQSSASLKEAVDQPK